MSHPIILIDYASKLRRIHLKKISRAITDQTQVNCYDSPTPHLFSPAPYCGHIRYRVWFVSHISVWASKHISRVCLFSFPIRYIIVDSPMNQ